MKTDLRRVRIHTIEDLHEAIEGVRADHSPRLIQEEDGTVLAVLMDPDHFSKATKTPKSRINRDRLLKFAGIWSDLDADAMIADIYRWRDEAPQSPDPSLYFLDEEEEADADSNAG